MRGSVPTSASTFDHASPDPNHHGKSVGQRIHRNLAEARFRRVFFSALLLHGAYIAVRAFL